MQVFLKARDMTVKPKNLRGKGMLAGKFSRTINTSLPGRNRHQPIISSVVRKTPGALKMLWHWL
jgi:hypothetical protein